ncbi:hypothetical protein PILCRDRAFT_822718 [Piloderma croceum F 1598]|uniref:Uncharacterized protein n=1 Tax=Piloderma croceum (strain F 1598) TaxID=765440 RepID=A0A0C3FJY4_PILCF|nr:hypothetical protein PILCRDRAFT_822718 [Piloderma croceum F 1598]
MWPAVGHEALAGFGRWQGGIGMVGTQFVRTGGYLLSVVIDVILQVDCSRWKYTLQP